MNQEMMKLYKEHKVSPVSGCLPMLLMIPFFFAFYRLLMSSIELRHAPFLLWIHDLSQFDPYFVLPILMGATQIGIQKMTPQTTVDPVQAKIMQFMPTCSPLLALAPRPGPLLVLEQPRVHGSASGDELVAREGEDEGPARAKAKRPRSRRKRTVEHGLGGWSERGNNAARGNRDLARRMIGPREPRGSRGGGRGGGDSRRPVGEDRDIVLCTGRRCWKPSSTLNRLAENRDAQRILVDCDGYRARKAELREIALRVSDRGGTGAREELGLMNPYERRIVHLAVAEPR
jgi:hypothetical protein